ncbi:hypothetical protein GY45DRAFT_898781 [Cubamyces sp. BRFM 1775]|nr:hypothetical protein GY45DRAFT_898781 [Cubamyces sp. BRFM 1775]
MTAHSRSRRTSTVLRRPLCPRDRGDILLRRSPWAKAARSPQPHTRDPFWTVGPSWHAPARSHGTISNLYPFAQAFGRPIARRGELMQFADPATAARQTPTRARGHAGSISLRPTPRGDHPQVGTVGATPWERRAYLAFRACARPPHSFFLFAHLFPARAHTRLSSKGAAAPPPAATSGSWILGSEFWTERQSDRWTAFASRDEWAVC